MKFIALSTLVTLALAAPQVTDTFILQYALTLEHLEDNFYRTGLAKFKEADFKAAGLSSFFYNNIKTVAADEADHVKALTGALKDKAVGPCVYNFPPMEKVSDFLNVAAVLEGVGVSAYAGAAPDIKDKAYVAVGLSIHSVEARHAAYVRGGKPMPQRPFPAPYDIALGYRQVFSLAAGFIKSCPVDLGIKPFPALMATGGTKAGEWIYLSTEAKPANNAPLYAGFTVPGVGPMFTPVQMKDGKHAAQIPKGVAGQTYVVLQSGTTAPKAFNDDAVVAGPAFFESEPVSA